MILDQSIVIFKIPHYYVSKKQLDWSKNRRLLIPSGGSRRIARRVLESKRSMHYVRMLCVLTEYTSSTSTSTSTVQYSTVLEYHAQYSSKVL